VKTRPVRRRIGRRRADPCGSHGRRSGPGRRGRPEGVAAPVYGLHRQVPETSGQLRLGHLPAFCDSRPSSLHSSGSVHSQSTRSSSVFNSASVYSATYTLAPTPPARGMPFEGWPCDVRYACTLQLRGERPSVRVRLLGRCSNADPYEEAAFAPEPLSELCGHPALFRLGQLGKEGRIRVVSRVRSSLLDEHQEPEFDQGTM
jgi:hypothetical protein